VQVPACDEAACRTSLDVRIHNKWYDLSGKHKHRIGRKCSVFLSGIVRLITCLFH
jgi:hypothetical protein